MNFATFDLNLLRVLNALFHEGTTIKAGERLGLSQSAVSGALSRLRNALNDRLFVRQGNRLVATDYAVSLREDLAVELERLELLLSPSPAFEPSTAAGNFKISASDFFAELLMPPLADRLNRIAPNIRVQLVDLVPEDHLLSLERHAADLALIPDIDLPDWVNHEALFHSPFVVIARSGNPDVAGLADWQQISMDTFCDLSHVLFSPEGNLQAMGDAALARVGRKRQVNVTVPVFSGVCRAVSQSNLIALVPEQLAVDIADMFQLRIFKPPMHIEPAMIIGVWHRRSDASPFARWVRNQVFDLMKMLD